MVPRSRLRCCGTRRTPLDVLRPKILPNIPRKMSKIEQIAPPMAVILWESWIEVFNCAGCDGCRVEGKIQPPRILQRLTLDSLSARFVKVLATSHCTPPAVTAQLPQQQGTTMVELEKPRLDAAAFLANAGLGRSIMKLTAKEAFFSQGDPADSVFIFRKAVQRSRWFPQREGSYHYPKNSSYLTKARQFRVVFSVGAG